MSTRGKLKQYIIVLDMLKKKSCSSNILLDRLTTNGFSISKRTLQRVIEELRYEFDLDITYDNHQNQYALAHSPETRKIDTLIRLFENTQAADTLLELIKERKEGLQYLSPQSSELLKGFDHLSYFLKAITEKKVVEFDHENFTKGGIKKHTLQPYMLKEYLYRWYLIGICPQKNNALVFGIDRISNLTITKSNFTPDPCFPYDILFENIIGLDFSKGQVEKIILSLDAIAAKYIESFPLHASQKTITKNNQTATIELSLIPNYELTQQILRLGNRVEVVSPLSLRKEIAETLSKSLAKYR